MIQCDPSRNPAGGQSLTARTTTVYGRKRTMKKLVIAAASLAIMSGAALGRTMP
jgi:hypothetical protein